jgi:hypothetical protein
MLTATVQVFGDGGWLVDRAGINKWAKNESKSRGGGTVRSTRSAAVTYDGKAGMAVAAQERMKATEAAAKSRATKPIAAAPSMMAIKDRRSRFQD